MINAMLPIFGQNASFEKSAVLKSLINLWASCHLPWTIIYISLL